jgi:hypothetical protein
VLAPLHSHRRDQAARDAAPYVHAKLLAVGPHHDTQGEPTSSVYVEQITVVAVESGKFLSSAEATEPIIEILPDRSPFAVELLGEPEPETAAPEGPSDAACE